MPLRACGSLLVSQSSSLRQDRQRPAADRRACHKGRRDCVFNAPAIVSALPRTPCPLRARQAAPSIGGHVTGQIYFEGVVLLDTISCAHIVCGLTPRNSAASPSAIVGWVRIASRRAM